MRIALIISSLGPGGAERVMSLLANALSAKGHEITIVTLADASSPPFYPLADRVSPRPLGVLGRSGSLRQKLANNWRRLRTLRTALETLAPEVVLSFMDQTNVLTLAAAWGLGLPAVVSERVDPRYYDSGLVWRILRKLTYPRAASVVFQTGQVRDCFPFGVRRKSRVIPNPAVEPPVSREAFRSLRPGENPVIIGLGRLTRQKGFDLLLRAFAALAPRHREWRMEIWGEGEDRFKLEQLSLDLGLASKVTWPGLTRDPGGVLARADLFVLPSRFEGFPNVLLEAMSLGRPVISFDCPSGPGDIIRHQVDGLLVPPEDVVALSRAMSGLMTDAKERRRLAARAIEVKTRFSLDKVVAMWEETLRSAVDKRR
ncbi:MAG: glycosyltransferase family 4 protein [Thermodesulfobacteriota bacterium]